MGRHGVYIVILLVFILINFVACSLRSLTRRWTRCVCVVASRLLLLGRGKKKTPRATRDVDETEK